MKRLLLVALIGILTAEVAYSQSFFAMRRNRSLMLTVGTGTSSYFGELSNDNQYLQANLNIHAGFQYYLNKKIAIRSEISFFQLSGSDALAASESRKPRNLSFNEKDVEISFCGVFNLFPQGRSFYQRPAFNMYGFLGIGLLHFNPKTTYQGQVVELAPLHTELVSYSLFTPVIPMGIGVRFKLGPVMNLCFEGGYRMTFTDYLDDVSTVHHDASKFSNPMAYALSDRRPELGLPNAPDGYIRGNPKTNDSYILFSAKLEYYLPVNFFERNSAQKTFKTKRKAYYRYNKRGGLKN